MKRKWVDMGAARKTERFLEKRKKGWQKCEHMYCLIQQKDAKKMAECREEHFEEWGNTELW